MTTGRPEDRRYTHYLAGRTLLARGHEVGGRRARIHDPDAIVTSLIRQSGGCRRGARHGNGHVHARVFLVSAHEVVPHRAVLGLYARAVFFRSVERVLGLIAHRFELQILRHAVEVAHAGALHREWLVLRHA